LKHRDVKAAIAAALVTMRTAVNGLGVRGVADVI